MQDRMDDSCRVRCIGQPLAPPSSRMKKQILQSIYALHKSEPSPCTHYRGDHESALLFQARVGALMTNCRRAQLFGDTDTACPLCGQSSEDVFHMLLWLPCP
ncbi:hypothetical protein ISCGN_009101 [Ixodes scapularis]